MRYKPTNNDTFTFSDVLDGETFEYQNLLFIKTHGGSRSTDNCIALSDGTLYDGTYYSSGRKCYIGNKGKCISVTGKFVTDSKEPLQ